VKRLGLILVLVMATSAYGSDLPREAGSALITPMMGSVETHWVYFSDDTFEEVLGERGYNCYRTFSWGIRTNYVLDLGGGACDESGGGTSGSRCYVDGFETTCPATSCYFLGTCEPCTPWGCPSCCNESAACPELCDDPDA
jgi:hypothetical protein